MPGRCTNGSVELGYAYGPAFRAVRAAWSDGDDLFAELTLPDELLDQAADFPIHPALLDAALHPLVGREAREGAGLPVPFAWSGIELFATGATAVRARWSSGRLGHRPGRQLRPVRRLAHPAAGRRGRARHTGSTVRPSRTASTGQPSPTTPPRGRDRYEWTRSETSRRTCPCPKSSP